MKKILYIDREFQQSVGGDKNRSRYLHRVLSSYADVSLCSIDAQEHWDVGTEGLALQSLQATDFLTPDAIEIFSQKTLDTFVSYIAEKKIQTLFFRTIAFSALAIYAKTKLPDIQVYIDVDLVLSRLMQQAWKKNKSFTRRYYLLESYKLAYYEQKLYQNDFTFLFSNEEEASYLQVKYPQTRVEYLANTTDLEAKSPQRTLQKTILFYGVMNSSANKDAYDFLQRQLLPILKEDLEKYDYEIHIVGRACESLDTSKHSRLKIIGEVASIAETLEASAFVLLPIFIASGTNTRVIETAMSGKALVTTSLAMEGLSSSNPEYICDEAKTMAKAVCRLMQNTQEIQRVAENLQEDIVEKFSFRAFEQCLLGILQKPRQDTISLAHVPRRFTQSSWGGTETVVMNSAKNLEALGYRSSIFTSKALDTKSKEDIEAIPIRRFDYFYPFFALSSEQKESFDAVGGNLFSFSLLFALLREKNIQILHLHTLKRMGGIVRSIAKWRKIPYVITLHGGYFNRDIKEVQHRQRQLEQGYEWGKILGFLFGSRKVIEDASAIITLSKEEYASAHAKYGEKVHYLANGVDIQKFSNTREAEGFKKRYSIAQDARMLLCSARIDTQKNQLLLLEVFAQLQKRFSSLHLVCLGAVSDKEYFVQLQNYIQDNDLGTTVSFVQDLTPKDQLLVDAYNEAEILVLPSRHEPFGMVVLEAWSAHTPVVASHTGGIGRIISHNENGLMFENGNGDDLHEQMAKVLASATLAKELADKAFVEVQKYDWKHIANNLDTIYKKLLKSA